MEHKIYSAIERSETSIPIKDILSPEGVPQFFPEIKSRGYFDLDFRANKLVLVAGKYIGLIPINERIAINVEPKVGVGNLVHIISKSRENLDSLNFFQRTYKEAASISPTIFDFFAVSLTIELQKIEKEGMYKKYISRTANTASPRGRINIGRTAALNWSKGTYYKACFDYFEFTANNHFNRMIKFTLWYCINHLLTMGSKNLALIKSLSYFFDYFESIPLDKNRNFLNPVIEEIHDQKIPILRIYYENICKICRSIIEDVGITLIEQGEDIKLLSFIINMEHVFERYLMFVLRENSHSLGPDYLILDGNNEGKGYLLQDSTKYEIKPDIIVRNVTGTKLIIDAKYKNKPTEHDRFQILAHAISYGAKNAILIMPYSGTTSGLMRQGRFGGESGVELYEYYIDLENVNLENEEMKYVTSMKDLCVVNQN